jgi:hypothetical protein
VCGIIGMAVAVKEIVHHPDQPLPGDALTALAVGVTLFVCASAFAYWRMTGRLLVFRLVTTGLTLVAIAAVRETDPIWPLAAVAAGLLVIVVVEDVAEVGDADELGDAATTID